MDRGGDEFRGVEGNVVLHALREPARQLRHLRSDFIHHGQRVGAGRLEYRHARGWPTVKGEGLRIGLRAELHAPDVADAGHRAARAGLDDHLLELRRVGQPPGNIERVLEAVSGRRGRADLPGGNLRALLLQCRGHIVDRQAARLHQRGVKPDPHRVLAGPEHVDVADARQASHLLLEIDRRVVAEIQTVVVAVGSGQSDDAAGSRSISAGRRRPAPAPLAAAPPAHWRPGSAPVLARNSGRCRSRR